MCFGQTYSVLYNFDGAPGNGIGPSGALVEDANGNLYGTTQVGGANSVGAIFKLTPAGDESILYSFALPPNAMLPLYGVIRDSSGNLYGSTPAGGKFGANNADGTVFKLTGAGAERVLHNFGSGKDGVNPEGALVRDAQGNLYGTTFSGGASNTGTIFEITPAGREMILHNFTPAQGSPEGVLLRDAHGNLFGTTLEGGTNGFGTVYELSAAGKFSVLYNFCSQLHCADGSSPTAGVIEDSAGNLYGTTETGGANLQGTVFELTKAGKETVLHSFGLAGGDGYFPMAGLVRDNAGNLYGTTFVGGANHAGTIFEIDAAGNETLLHSFCADANCTDGSSPSLGGLLRDAAGNLYGTAGQGAFQAGLVFKLAP